MALTIGQIAAISYPAVLADNRKAANQWSESAFLRELERQGAIVRKSLGSTIEAPLDYRRNPGAGFLTSPLQPTSLSETEIVTAAQYDKGAAMFQLASDLLEATLPAGQKTSIINAAIQLAYTSYKAEGK